jgi:type II secretory pathway component GspD/PulD (secretin)
MRFALYIAPTLALLVACVTTDENGRRTERVKLKDFDQTLLGENYSLKAPDKDNICQTDSKDMQVTIDALNRAEKYVRSVGSVVMKSSDLPRKLVSMDYSDNDLREALLELGDQIGVNVVMGDEVQGTVSVKLSDVPVSRALPMMIASGGFDYVYNGSYIYVGDSMRKDGASANAFLTRHNYKTHSAPPKLIIDSLSPTAKNYVTANDAMGIVSISAPRQEFRTILKEVVSLDRPSRQIRLRLSVAYVSDAAMDTLGKKVAGTGYSAANVMDPIQPSFGQGVYDKVSFDQFLRGVQLMSTTGETEIKAEPEIITLDGEKAVFGSKQTSLVRRADGALDKNNALEGGIQMKIEPRIVDNEDVLLSIEEAKSGDINDIDRDSTSEQSISTKVRVQSGKVLVLGGLKQAKVQTIISKVPFFGDIPYLGWLFKSKREEILHTQVIFAIMPEIVCN